MSFTSYAQNFEDVLLWRALGHVENGRYLDIGAQDPVQDSVSLAFYNAGWRGVHVEPAPGYAALLREARPDETVIQAAVSDAPGPIEFHCFPDTGLSTGDADIAARHRQHGFSEQAMLVPCVRLDQLLARSEQDFQWLKIDVEGLEADVLRSWRNSERRPWVLLIEATEPGTPYCNDHRWVGEVEARGYRSVHFDGVSRYFVHESQKDLEARLEASPNLFDGFNLASQHFAARAIVAAHQSEMEAVKSAAIEQSRADQEVAAAALAVAEGQRSEAVNSKRAALEQLVAAEQLHRAKVKELSQERQVAEQTLHTAADGLRQQIEAANARTADVLTQLEVTGDQLNRAKQDSQGLRTAFSILQADHVRAEVLIDAVINARPSAWERIGRALSLSRQPQALQLLSRWRDDARAHSPNSSPIQAVQASTDMLQLPPPANANPYHRANSLAELLAWRDADFVRCAYVTILGRQPDPDGEAYYTRRLRSGHSKLGLLAQLRRSPEGPKHDPGISGLDRALRRARWEHNRFVGGLVRIFTQGEGDGAEWQQRRRIEDQLTVLAEARLEDRHVMMTTATKVGRIESDVANHLGPRPAEFLSVPARNVFGSLASPADPFNRN